MKEYFLVFKKYGGKLKRMNILNVEDLEFFHYILEENPCN